jgi:AhpD family alkylhydroperoxidase
LHSPELGKAFESFYRMCNEDGVVDKKTKELLMLAVAAVLRCPDHAEEHVKLAFRAGATKEEITEVLLIVAAESARTSLASGRQICLKHLGVTSKE